MCQIRTCALSPFTRHRRRRRFLTTITIASSELTVASLVVIRAALRHPRAVRSFTIAPYVHLAPPFMIAIASHVDARYGLGHGPLSCITSSLVLLSPDISHDHTCTNLTLSFNRRKKKVSLHRSRLSAVPEYYNLKSRLLTS